jgi:hypothetical protein
MNRLCSLIIGAVFLLIALGACSLPGGVFEAAGNVGSCKFPGYIMYDASTEVYTLMGSGTNMWGTADAFFMTWKRVDGDFTLSAKVAFEGEGVDPHRKIGLIVRESLRKGAIYADVAVHGDGLTSLQYRPGRGVETEEFVSPNKAPDYVLLQRVGNKIVIKTAFDTYPTDTDAEVTLDLPTTCYVGLFVCSHNPEVIETAYFSLVELK